MKSSNIITTFLFLTATFFLTSCDGGGGGQSATGSEDIAESLDVPEDGDVIYFNSASGANILSSLEFANGMAVVGGGETERTFRYSKTGENSFSLVASSTVNPQVNMEKIVANLLGGSAALETEFKELISRDTPDFTAAELDRLIFILNLSGASITGTSVGELAARAPGGYSLTVTSNVGDQIRGSMGGVYNLDTIQSRVSFDNPTQLQINTYRFLSPNSQIPVISDQFVSSIDTNGDNGTWIINLNL